MHGSGIARRWLAMISGGEFCWFTVAWRDVQTQLDLAEIENRQIVLSFSTLSIGCMIMDLRRTDEVLVSNPGLVGKFEGSVWPVVAITTLFIAPRMTSLDD